ncbi:hypothetical protein SELMODRAFT_134942 [Selaginella moellendorffii]|uniref:O-methyltransferase domain-containing protein n=1 Tax=Selaginella moellendorffii TaxID=88036 RepID=D8T9B3_SELML|nr:hypothetical protein SELMODRAFT_134972 [Selaginella moellendorffii]EFJ06722.1 hypothetical protein SELMODRAFT_134942 [Selaginella moellendorffii]
MAAFAPGEELVLYATIPLALNAVVKLGAFDEIADSVLSASEIVSRITNNPSANVAFLDRTLRVLATYGVVNETVVQGQRKYGLSEIGKRFSPGTKLAARGLSVMCNHRIFLKPFEHLAEGILDGGEPFRKAHGKTAYELVAEEPEFNNSFNLCMADHSKRSSAVLLDCYKGFASIKTLVDVGGGNGALLCDIRTRYPHIKGINFDQPHVVSQGIASEGILSQIFHARSFKHSLFTSSRSGACWWRHVRINSPRRFNHVEGKGSRVKFSLPIWCFIPF